MKPLWALLFMLLSASCFSRDVYMDRLANSINPYVMNRHGEIEIAPKLYVIADEAKAVKNNTVTMTAFVTDKKKGKRILVGEFAQSCGILPAKQFVEYVTEETKKSGEALPLVVKSYHFVVDRIKFMPGLLMVCALREADTPVWRGLMNFKNAKPPESAMEYDKQDSPHYVHIINSEESYFFF